MLVLSRKVGEKIIISNNIILTVVAVGGHQVRLGIDAPDDVRIVRSELLHASGARGRAVMPAERREAEPALNH